jgi:cyanophycin synthetase
VTIEDIRTGLQTFFPSSAQLPGRMNVFEFEKYKVLIDYAHNPPSMEAIGKFVSSLGAGRKVGILAGTGDRRDEDLMDYGRVAAEYFDQLIVWKDDDYARGRDSMEIMDLIVKGAGSNPRKPDIQVILDEDEAVDHALATAGWKTVIAIFTGRIEAMTARIKAWKEKELDLTITKDDIPNM